MHDHKILQVRHISRHMHWKINLTVLFKDVWIYQRPVSSKKPFWTPPQQDYMDWTWTESQLLKVGINFACGLWRPCQAGFQSGGCIESWYVMLSPYSYFQKGNNLQGKNAKRLFILQWQGLRFIYFSLLYFLTPLGRFFFVNYSYKLPKLPFCHCLLGSGYSKESEQKYKNLSLSLSCHTSYYTSLPP